MRVCDGGQKLAGEPPVTVLVHILSGALSQRGESCQLDFVREIAPYLLLSLVSEPQSSLLCMINVANGSTQDVGAVFTMLLWVTCAARLNHSQFEVILSKQKVTSSVSKQEPAASMMNTSAVSAPMCLGDCKGETEDHFHSSKSIQHLLDNNKKWREDLTKRDASLFDRLSEGQYPPYLWIGCSDSRVPAEEITGLDPGEMFCHRNVANLVVTNDINVLSVVQYAVESLKVKDIIVCGHYGCGGVKAAMENKHIGILDTWLRTVRDVHRKHKEELDALPTDEARYRRTVELNVKQQCLNIFKMNVVQHRLGRPDQPNIHGLVYDIKTGGLKELKVDYCGYYAKLVGEDSLHAFPDGEATMGLAHRRRNAILDLADGLEKEPGVVRIRYMARMLQRETDLFTPEEVEEAIEAIKGQMEDPKSSFIKIKDLIAYFAPMKPKDTT